MCDPLSPGDHIGGMQIIRQLSAGSKEATKYWVSCLRCGRESESAHVNLERRARRELYGCRICNRHEAQPRAPRPQPPVPGVMIGRDWWPSLSGWAK